RQVEMLGISRGSLCYDACPVSAADLAIMRRIGALHLDYPFPCSRMPRFCCAGVTAVVFAQDETDGSDPVQAAALLVPLPFPSLQSPQCSVRIFAKDTKHEATRLRD